MADDGRSVAAEMPEEEGNVPVFVTGANVQRFLADLTQLMRVSGIIIHSDRPEDIALVKHSTGRTLATGLSLNRKNCYETRLAHSGEPQ